MGVGSLYRTHIGRTLHSTVQPQGIDQPSDYIRQSQGRRTEELFN
jgi:hypothetical protein